MISYFSKCWSYCKNLFIKRFVLEQDKLWLGNELLGRVVFKARGRQNANCKCYFFPADYSREYTFRELVQIHSLMHDLLPVESSGKARVSEAKVYSVLKAGDNYRCDKLLGKIVEGKFVPSCTLEIHELASVIAADWKESVSGLLDQNQVDWFEGVE